jgi:hypothetical protein
MSKSFSPAQHRLYSPGVATRVGIATQVPKYLCSAACLRCVLIQRDVPSSMCGFMSELQQQASHLIYLPTYAGESPKR